MLKKLKGWRTVVVAGATFVTGALSYAGIVDVPPEMIVDVFDKGLMLLGAVFAVLRVATKGPVGKGE